MIGKRIGLLTVVTRLNRDQKLGQLFLCRCDCGNEKVVPHSNLLTENTRSCGCLRRRRSKIPFAGASELREYNVWRHMRDRCLNPKAKAYPAYGGRGVILCDAWRDSFSAFLADMGPAPSRQHTIDRIDNYKGYEPGNCRWADWHTQQNNKRNSRMIELDGVTKTLAQWSDLFGVKRQTAFNRFKRGVRPELIFSTKRLKETP